MAFVHEHSWKLDADPGRVYAALTDPAQLTRWFAERVELALEPRGPYRFWGKHTLGCPAPDGAQQRITRIEPGRVLEFDWALYGVPTHVAISLASEDSGSRLTLHHAVTGDLGVPRQSELIDDHWRLAFGNLTCHLAGGTGILLPDYSDPAPEIRLTITIDAPPEAVFRALIEPDAINRWFGQGGTVVEPRVGGRYDLGWKYQVDGKDVVGGPTTILEFEPNRKLVLDWPDWRGDKAVTGQTISFELEPVDTGTRVTFVHAGFTRTTDLSDYPFGWSYFLGRLVPVASSMSAV